MFSVYSPLFGKNTKPVREQVIPGGVGVGRGKLAGVDASVQVADVRRAVDAVVARGVWATAEAFDAGVEKGVAAVDEAQCEVRIAVRAAGVGTVAVDASLGGDVAHVKIGIGERRAIGVGEAFDAVKAVADAVVVGAGEVA